jgi:hypothetical protein
MAADNSLSGDDASRSMGGVAMFGKPGDADRRAVSRSVRGQKQRAAAKEKKKPLQP